MYAFAPAQRRIYRCNSAIRMRRHVDDTNYKCKTPGCVCTYVRTYMYLRLRTICIDTDNTVMQTCAAAGSLHKRVLSEQKPRITRTQNDTCAHTHTYAWVNAVSGDTGAEAFKHEHFEHFEQFQRLTGRAESPGSYAKCTSPW